MFKDGELLPQAARPTWSVYLKYIKKSGLYSQESEPSGIMPEDLMDKIGKEAFAVFILVSQMAMGYSKEYLLQINSQKETPERKLNKVRLLNLY